MARNRTSDLAIDPVRATRVAARMTPDEPGVAGPPLFLAVALVSGSMLALETLLPRVFAIYVGPNFVYFSISIALVGLSSGGIIGSIWERRFGANPRRTLVRLALLFSITTVLAIWACSLAGSALNGVIDAIYSRVLQEQGVSRSLAVVSREIAGPSMLFVLVTGLVAAVPFLFAGLFVALALRFSSGFVGAVYASDLAGGAVGCAFTVLALTFLPVGAALLALSLATACAGLTLALGARADQVRTRSARTAALVILACAGLMTLDAAGRPLLRFTIHRYAHLRSIYDGAMTELRAQWTPLGRIALLVRQWSPPLNSAPRQRTKHFVAMDLGGHSVLETFTPANLAAIKNTSVFSDEVLEPIVVPGLYLPLREYLVLMAGNGQDMLRAYAWYGGRIRLQGVELNPVVYEFGLEYAPANLRAFFRKPTIAMAIDEGRAFVERSRRTYDVILLSYSGATFATGTGSLASTPQFLFTREAFRSYLARLTAGGVLVEAAGVPPDRLPRSLLTFKAALADVDPQLDVKRLVICYAARGREDAEQYAIYHRRPPSAAQVARLEQALSRHNMAVTYSPFTGPKYPALARFVDSGGIDRPLPRLFRARAQDRVHSDDRPFFYFDLNWGAQGGLLVIGYVATLLSALLVAVLFLGVPLWLERSERARTPAGPTAWRDFAGFALLGAGFMLIEVGSIQKFELFLGNPTLTLVAILAVLLVCSATGSFLSTKLFDRGLLTIGRSALLVVAYGALVLVFLNRAMYAAMALPVGVKISLIALVLFPLGFPLGTMFPQLLRRLDPDRRRYIPLALGLNGIFSVFSANFGAIIYLFVGATAVFLLGLACYLALWLDERARRSPAAARRQMMPASV